MHTHLVNEERSYRIFGGCFFGGIASQNGTNMREISKQTPYLFTQYKKKGRKFFSLFQLLFFYKKKREK